MSKLRIGLCLLATALAHPLQLFGDDVMREVRSGNRSALESIQTLHCVVKKSVLVTSVGHPHTVESEHWLSGNLSRVRLASDGRWTDLVVNDSVARAAVPFREDKGTERIRYSIMRMEPGEPHGRNDPWAASLLKLCGPKGWPRTLEELLTSPHQLKSVDRRSEDGADYIVIAMSLELLPGESGHFEFWFDPRVNYLAKKVTGTSGSDKSLRRRESNVLAFKEVLPAVYFPERVETRQFHGEQLVQHEIVEFSGIEINRPIPAETFELAIPPGATVYDSIEGVEYEVDSNGNRVGQVKEVPRFGPLPVGVNQATRSGEEPWPWPRSILIASLAVFFIGVSVWVFRQWKRESGLSSN